MPGCQTRLHRHPPPGSPARTGRAAASSGAVRRPAGRGCCAPGAAPPEPPRELPRPGSPWRGKTGQAMFALLCKGVVKMLKKKGLSEKYFVSVLSHSQESEVLERVRRREGSW